MFIRVHWRSFAVPFCVGIKSVNMLNLWPRLVYINAGAFLPANVSILKKEVLPLKIILIVDDSQIQRGLLCCQIRPEIPAAQVLEAGDVAAARSLAERCPEPGIAVIDWNLLPGEASCPLAASRVSDGLARDLIAVGWEVFRLSGSSGNIPSNARGAGAFGREEQQALVRAIKNRLD